MNNKLLDVKPDSIVFLHRYYDLDDNFHTFRSKYLTIWYLDVEWVRPESLPESWTDIVDIIHWTVVDVARVNRGEWSK